MAFEYFLYTTLYNNTLVDKGANSFAPLPPNSGQIYIDFLIPETQPLYLYRESGGTIVLNDEQTINNYLNTTNPPTPSDPVDIQTFTGYTAQTETQYNNLVASLSGVSTGITINEIGFHTDATAALTLTNQVIGETFLANSNRNIKRFDLTNSIQIKLSARVVTASASVNNPRLILKYSPTFSATATNYLNIGATEVSVPLTGTSLNDSGWIDIVNTAKGEVYLTVNQIGGDGAADPSLGGVYVEVRNIVKTAEVINQGISEEIFSGYTATTQNQINNKIDKVTGATDFIPQFISNGNIISSEYKISDLTGGTSGNYLPLSGGTMKDRIFFDTDDGLGDREKVGSIGLGVENVLTLSATTAISLDAPSIQFKNASDSGYTGSILTVGKDGFIKYTTLTNEDVEFIDDTPNITTINDTNEHVIFEVTPNINIDKGFGEWYVRGNLPWWRNLTLRIRVNGVEKYNEIYTNTYDFILSKTVVLSETVNSGDTVQVTVQSDVAGYYIYGDYLKLVKYGLVAGIFWGTIGGNIDDQSDLINRLNQKVNRSGDTITGDLKVEGSIYVTGTTATTEELSNSVLLGAITSDGRIVATNTPALNVSEKVTDITGDTIITELSGIYYVDTSLGDVTIQVPDASPSNDVSRLSIIKKTIDTNLVFVTTTGGTQYIGNATTQSIGQQDKGIGIVSDADNGKWLITQDSRFPSGNDEGTLLAWDNTDKVWKSTTDDVTWDRVGLKFNVGGNSIPQTFQVDATQDIVYINTTGLTGIVGADDLGLYAGGRGAFGNAVTLDRLRANAAGNVPRSFSLIDTNAVMRIWRYINDTNDPAVELIWGTEATPVSVGNAWWDMFLDGGAAPNDVFAIRRRTEGNDQTKISIGNTVVNIPITTTSTSPTTGALTVGGGVGIAGDLSVGSTISGVTLFENGVSLVNKYLQMSNFNTYSGNTATAIGLKANIASPTFTGIPAAPTASANTNTTQLATTAFVLGQAADTLPIVNGIATIGTSLRYARQDHIHATDTSRQATITGAASTITSSNLTANRILISDTNGKVAASTITVAQLTAVTTNVYGTQFQLVQSLGTSTTTSATPQTKVTLTTPSLPAGTYKILTSWVGTASNSTNDMLFDVTLNGTPLGTRTTINVELQDATTYLSFVRPYYQALSGVNTIVLRYWSENAITTTISDAQIELIRVS